MHILLIFLDGIGLGDDDATINPFAAAHTPTLHALAAGQRWLRSTGIQHSERAVFIPTDPRLGVEGRPQSGTGQATIVTGRNVPQITGRHYGPKPDEATRDLLDDDNLFKQLVAKGYSAAYLEAHPPAWHASIESGKTLPSSYQYAARSAGLPFPTADDLRAGRALSGDWTARAWNARLGYSDMPELTAHATGERLVELSRGYDFAFMSHWMTDFVGHRGSLDEAIRLLETFDGVMGGVLDRWQDDEGLIVITSDHGNMEHIGNRHHTENDVPTVVIGGEKDRFAAGLRDLSQIAPRILHWLDATELPLES